MKSLLRTWAALLLCVSGVVVADQQAIIHAPDYIQILALDDQEKDFFSAALGGGESTKKVEPGIHFLKVRYSDLFDIGGGDHETVKSKPFAIEFEAKAGQAYDLKMVRPASLQAAQKILDNVEISVVERSSNVVVATNTSVYEYRVNKRQAINSPQKNAMPEAPRAVATTKAGQPDAMSMLKYWWQSATPEQKQAFMKWVYTQ